MATNDILYTLLNRIKLELEINETWKYDDLVCEYIKDAMDDINKYRKYNPTEDEPVESEYYGLIVDMCVARFNKRGAEGETTHSENGVVRDYEKGSPYPPSLLGRIIPKVGGVKK